MRPSSGIIAPIKPAGIRAVGDVACGASLVVRAISDGRDVAAHMHSWLKAEAASAKGAA